MSLYWLIATCTCMEEKMEVLCGGRIIDGDNFVI